MRLKKLLLLLFCFTWFSLYAQPPFVCDGDFFLSLGTGNNTGFYRVQVDPTTGVVTFSGFSPGNNSGAQVNAMGYRVTDNLIYGVSPQNQNLYKIGSDGLAVFVANLSLNSAYSYVAGDVSPDGNSLVILGHGGTPGISREVVTVDLTGTNYTTSTQVMTMSTGGNSDVFTADITFDPLTGILYGYDTRDNRLITLDPVTGVVNAGFPAGQGANVLGAMYFDAFGELHAYGRPINGNTQNTYFDIDKNTGVLTAVTTGPSASSNDGCSCPFTLEIKHWVSPSPVNPCDTTFYYIKVANNSGGDKTGLDIITELPAGIIIDQLIYNPYGGTVVSGPGTPLLSLENVTVPVGQDSLVFSVIIDPMRGGIFRSQARLLGLPPALGDSVFSDDPFTPPFLDSATLIIIPDTIDLPNQTAEFCAGDILTLDVSGHNALFYQWNDGSTGSTLDVTTPGTYWVASSECEVLMDTFVVTENPLPMVNAGPDQDICSGEGAMMAATGAVNYQWSFAGIPGVLTTGPNPTFSPVDTTSYVVLGTDANGCQNRDTIRINVKPLPVIAAGNDTAICAYDSLLLGSALNPPGTYLWSPNGFVSNPAIPQPWFLPPAPGVYPMDLQVTGLNGCTNTSQVVINVTDFQLSITTDDVDCFGNDNGAAAMQVTGSPQFDYYWLTGGSVFNSGTQGGSLFDIDSLAPGNYAGVVVDANGCRDSVLFSISQPAAPLDVMIQNLQNVDCFGNANGALTAQGTGGTTPYEYSINGGFSYQAAPLFTGLGATQYTIQVRDRNGCLATISDTISSPTGLFGDLLDKKDVRCFGINDGRINLEGRGGTMPYSLTLDGINYVNGLTLNNLGPGQDTVVLQDANGCIVPVPFEIFEPTPLTSSLVFSRNIDCFGFNTGEILLVSNGGSLPHLYSVDGINFQTDSLFRGLNAGIYDVIVQDDSLCQDTVPVTLTEPPLLELTNVYQKNVDCFGNVNGEIDIQAMGGTLPYSFTIDSISFQTTGFFGGLGAGDYSVTVIDDSSCVTQLPVQIIEPPLLEIALTDQANVACNGDSTAFIRLQANGGSPAYVFSLDSLNYQADTLFAGLPAGNFLFWVLDDSSCTTRIDVDITEPPLLELLVSEQRHVDCFGNANGLISVGAQGGVPAYQFSANGGAWQGDGIFSQLPPGDYTLTVEDDSLCQQGQLFTITEPPLLELFPEKTDVTCYNFGDGRATVEVLGGTPDYQFNWNSEPPQFTREATGLSGGLYEVLVTDSSGCEEIAAVFVFEPDTLTLVLDPNSVSESYCDWPNGSAQVISTGGRLPHAITWVGRNNLSGHSVDSLYGGSYTVAVTDSMGCLTTIEIDIPETPPPIPFFITDPTYEDSILLSQANVQFTNQTQYGITYVWDFGDGGLSDQEHPIHSYRETGVFPVKLTAYNSYFVCPRDTTILLHIIPDGSLFLPNAFSPNDDGLNDFFFLQGEGLVSYEMHIFDRWGRHIAVLNALSDRWDGRNESGAALPEGVYVFRVKAQMNDGSVLDRGGTITLVR